MPIYEYRCARGHNFDVFQKIDEDPVAVCETCDAPVERVFHPVAVHFKGSGFYTTDYGRKGRGSANGAGDGKPAEPKAGKGERKDKQKSKAKTGSQD